MAVNIIGAGPAGSFLAYLLAREGRDVNIFEKKPEVGRPIQCTGLLSSLDEPLIKKGLPNFLVNKTKKIALHSPKKKITLEREEYVICRYRFDNYLVDRAVDEGAKLLLNHEFIRSDKDNAYIKDRKRNRILKVRKDILIGADGPLSRVAKDAEIYGRREFYYGMQAVVKGDFNKERYDVFFGKEVSQDFFGWVVPESSDSARIGVASKKRPDLDRFFKVLGVDKSSIVEYQPGAIPIYSPRQQLSKGSTYLLGDAGCQVKASTLGGILPAMRAARPLKEAILNGEGYSPKRSSLYMHLKLRKFLDRFSDKDWDDLIGTIPAEEVSSMNREDIFLDLIKMIIKRPSLLKFAKKLL